MQLQLKRAGEDRELENKDFQATVADYVYSNFKFERVFLILFLTL